MNITPYVQHTKEFIKHWTKEIVVALVLAIVAAVMLDWYSDWYSEKSAGTYKRAIDLKPNDKDSMFSLALLSILTGDMQTARQILPSLMRLNEGREKEIEALIKIIRVRVK